MKNSSAYFENRDCKYYPCHKDTDEINCMFCYCPLYHLEKCGGNFGFTDKGVKDCSKCTLPHKAKNYQYIVNKLKT